MKLVDKAPATIAENLALEEALLLNAEAGGPEVLRIWETQAHAIVVGAAGKLSHEVDENACASDGVPIYRRSTGGGAVLIGPGCLHFSLILRLDRHPALGDLHASYRHILGRFAQAFSASVDGISDLTIGMRKISGNAQQRKRTHLLHHGTLLYAFDVGLIERYLKSPPRAPDYRAGRSHADFVTNVSLPRERLVEIVKEAWPTIGTMDDVPMSLVRQLVAEKYGNDSWTRRR